MSRDCPYADELRRWLVVGHDDPALDSHVESCPDCQRTVEEILAGSGPGAVRRGAPGRRSAITAAAASFLKRLEGAAPPEAGSAIDPDGHSTIVSADTRSDAPPAAAPAGYDITGELGKGGMGVVRLGHDRRLGREVAIKVLKPEFAGHRHLVRRFIEEAQLSSRLQHPAIPPVHELGELADGSPYFVMKVVKGRTLDALLKDRSRPLEDLPRLLHVIEQVCQAVAYAHAHGVIHRDLKPANVMVGEYGEVQVMDWGLAKVLSHDAPFSRDAQRSAEASALRCASRLNEEGTTQAGMVLGTYAYMPPEQARGEAQGLDRRCDVFGLGAILCEVLTGQPPYVATSQEVKAQAQMGHLAPARERLAACGADGELIDLAKQCLSAQAEERPADAAAVAAALSAYLAGVQERLRNAELERAAAEARSAEAKATAAAERKARWRTMALATAVLALVAASAGGALLLQRQVDKRQAEQARRDAEQRRTVESALDRAETLRQQTRWHVAAAVLEEARRVLGDDGPEDLRRRLVVSQAELALIQRLDNIRQRRSTLVDGKFDRETAARDYAAAFREAGLGEVGDDEKAVANRVRASGAMGPLGAALDDWAFVTTEPKERSWLLRVARLAHPDRWGDRFRDPDVWQDRRKLRALAREALNDKEAKLLKLSPQVLDSLGVFLGDSPEAIPLLRVALSRYPNDFWLSLDLGNALGRTQRAEEAAGYFRVAVALRPDSAVAHNGLANILRANKDPDGAIAAYRKAIDLDPKFGQAYSNFGNALYDKKDLDGAIAAYRKAINLVPRFAQAHCNLGSVLRAKNDLEGALAAFHKALDLDPNNALTHYNLGNVLYDRQDVDGAIAAFRKAIHLDPALGPAHYNLGTALSNRKNVDGAITEYRKAIAAGFKSPLVHINLGIALLNKNDPDGAMSEFRKAIDIDPRHPLAHYNLGSILHARNELDPAIAAYRKAIDLDPKFSRAQFHHGNALYDKKDLDGAIAAYRKAIHIDPRYPHAHFNLGIALNDKGDVDGAIAAFRTAIDNDPRDVSAHYKLAHTLQVNKDLYGAVREYRKAIDLNPNHAYAHCGLGLTLMQQGRFAEARVAIRRSVELFPRQDPIRERASQDLQQCERLLTLDERLSTILDGKAEPAGAAEWLALAQFCRQHKRLHATAARFYAAAFAADPKLQNDVEHQHRYNAARSSALAATGQADDARCLPDRVVTALRKQALRWLREDLALYTARPATNKRPDDHLIRQRLSGWLNEADLAPFRETRALARLEDDEREEWLRLWREVTTWNNHRSRMRGRGTNRLVTMVIHSYPPPAPVASAAPGCAP
jgi:tetratricopeptide (TPR) repeat protein/tRNA A-37 threonylcarbamoyl transferase component Bud32